MKKAKAALDQNFGKRALKREAASLERSGTRRALMAHGLFLVSSFCSRRRGRFSCYCCSQGTSFGTVIHERIPRRPRGGCSWPRSVFFSRSPGTRFLRVVFAVLHRFHLSFYPVGRPAHSSPRLRESYSPAGGLPWLAENPAPGLTIVDSSEAPDVDPHGWARRLRSTSLPSG